MSWPCVTSNHRLPDCWLQCSADRQNQGRQTPDQTGSSTCFQQKSRQELLISRWSSGQLPSWAGSGGWHCCPEVDSFYFQSSPPSVAAASRPGRWRSIECRWRSNPRKQRPWNDLELRAAALAGRGSAEKRRRQRKLYNSWSLVV